MEQKHFVKTFPDEEGAVGEEVRRGFNPDKPEVGVSEEVHTLVDPKRKDDVEATSEREGVDEAGRRQPWEGRRFDTGEERNPWDE